MIVPMKKATMLFEAGDAEATVRYLRTLGVLHVEHQNPPESRDIDALQERVALIDSALDVLRTVMAEQKPRQPQKQVTGDGMAAAHHIVELGRRREERESSSRNILSRISEWEPWGDVDLHRIQHLASHGIHLKLYQVPVSELGNFPGDVVVKTIFTAGNIAHCVAISRREFACGFPEILPPKEPLSVLKQRLIEQRDAMESLRGEILEATTLHDDLSGIRGGLEKEIEFQQVLSGMGQGGAIRYVTGYIPFDREGHLVEEARSRKWGILITEPVEEDNVPTLIRNPSWVGMIRPVLGLLGLTPGYHELDVSPLFLIFFSIFFGILIGDAGYGLVYLLMTAVLQRTLLRDPEMRPIVSLFYLLGSCAVVWGVLTGTFFGQEWLQSLGYQPLVPQLNDAGFMQSFCFFLGALHLSIAHSWRAILKFPALTALADVGWICVLWTAFLLARTLILGVAFPGWGLWLIGAGLLLVIFFTSPQASVVRTVGSGLGTVALSLVSNFTDVISYIRLFAVGLATVAIAETTNTLGAGFGEGIADLVAGIVIVFIGHGLNIILGPMSVLVHGVRLNVLEFSGHANVTWSGVAFEPLKE